MPETMWGGTASGSSIIMRLFSDAHSVVVGGDHKSFLGVSSSS